MQAAGQIGGQGMAGGRAGQGWWQGMAGQGSVRAECGNRMFLKNHNKMT